MTNVTQSSASSVSTKSNVRLTAFLGKGRIPTEESHDDKLEITFETTALDLPVYNYTFFVNESDFHQDREYFILLINRNGVHNVDVSVGSYYSTCQYYSESREKWDFTGCFVDPVSEPARSMCFCNHLTSFGATVIFPVNDIDFRDLAKLDFSQNPVAIVTCSVIFGLYIIFMVVAVRWDRKSLSDISVVPLCGKDADYKYEVTVITGRQRGAGTTANVGINLYGEYGKSGPCHLYKPGAFKRNSQDVLLIATDKNLGSLWKLRLWHDNSGLSAAWYVNHVIIRDLQTNQKYCFIVESWLTLKYEKCSIEKDIFAAGEEELQKFSWLFRTEASRGFAERHMWLSVWERPARSRFTCAQRVTCCVTLLYTYMAVNAMWYGAIKQTTLSDAVVSFDSVFSWEEIFVGIVSSFMVFPINLGIVAIFRRSRWRKTEGIKKPGTAQTIEIDCEISRPGSCADSYFAGTDFIVPYERESTADTISVHAGKLKRTGNLRISKEDASDEIQKDISESSNGSSDKKLQNVVSKTAASHMWWSYDSILNWPEHLPSWTDGQESRQNSASFHNRNNQASKLLKAEVGRASNQTNSQKGGIPKGEVKKSIMKRAPTRRFSLTDSIDAILEDEAFWSCNQSESSWTSCDNRSKDSDSIQDVAVDQSNTQQPNTNKPDEKDSNINNTENSTTDVKKEGGTKRSGLFRFSFRNPFSILLEKAQNLLRRRKNKIGDQGLQKNDLSVPAHTESTGENAESIPMETLNTTHSRPLSAENFNPRADPLLGTAIGGHAVLHSETAVNNIRDCTTADDANSQLQYTAGWSPQYSRRCSSVSWKRQLPVLAPVSSPTQQVMLPHWCIYLAYFLCFILSSFSVILVMLYVYRFGRVRALKWLVALIISFFQSFLIIEPLKVVFFAVFLAAVTKRFDSDNSQDLSTEILPVVEYNEKIKDVKMKPIGGYALLQAREEGRKVRRMHLLIRHTLVYVFYFWLIIIMNYASHDNKQFLMSARVKDVFVEDVFPGKDNYNFRSIISTSGYWTWLETVAAQGLHKHQLENLTTLGLPLGVARLRQVRSKTVKCPAESVMTSFGVSWITACGCYGDPGHVEDTSSYFEGWKPGVFPNATWFHQESALTNSYGEQGKVAWYSGGGYVQLLGSSYTETIDTIQKLKQQNWIDRGTRAVFLEWTLYNGNVNLYTVMTLLAEFPLSGGVLTSHSVRTIQRFELVYYTVDMLLVCKVLMGLVVCYLMVHCFLSFQQQRWHYLVSLWNLMELSVTVVSLTTMVIYIHNLVQDSEVFYQYLHNKTGFTSFIWSSYWYTVWKRLMASLLFLLMLLIVKQLRFIKPLSVFGKTLKYASSKLLGCVLIFLLLILTYSQLGSLVYGSIVMELQSVGWAFVTMVGIIRGDTSVIFDETLTVNKTFTILFFGTFLCAIFVVVMGLIIAVLCDAYKMIKCQMYYHNTLEVQDYEVIEFMMKRFKLWARIDKPKPAFRKVKFQGMPSVSSRTYSSQSSRTVHSMASSEHMTMDSLEDNTSQYMEQLLVQVVPRWEDMIAKLDQVVALEEEQQIIDKKINKLAKEMVLAKCQQQKKRASSTSQIVDQSDSRTVRSWSRSSSLVTSSSLVNERKNSKTNTQSQVTAATNARVSSDLENSSKWAVSRTDNPNSSVSAHRDRICTKLTAQMRRNSDVGKTMSSMNAMESKPPIASQSRNARITASRRNSVTAATPSDPIDITYNALKPFSDQSFRPPDVTSENYLPKPAKPAW